MANLHFNGPQSPFYAIPWLRGHLPISPSYGSSCDEEARVAETSFGDGYAQVAPDGINSVARVWPLTFKNRSHDVVKAVRDFLRGTYPYFSDRAPSDYFFWTPPAPDDEAEVKVRCTVWKLTFDEYDVATLTCTFKEVFDP